MEHNEILQERLTPKLETMHCTPQILELRREPNANAIMLLMLVVLIGATPVTVCVFRSFGIDLSAKPVPIIQGRLAIAIVSAGLLIAYSIIRIACASRWAIRLDKANDTITARWLIMGLGLRTQVKSLHSFNRLLVQPNVWRTKRGEIHRNYSICLAGVNEPFLLFELPIEAQARKTANEIAAFLCLTIVDSLGSEKPREVKGLAVESLQHRFRNSGQTVPELSRPVFTKIKFEKTSSGVKFEIPSIPLRSFMARFHAIVLLIAPAALFFVLFASTKSFHFALHAVGICDAFISGILLCVYLLTVILNTRTIIEVNGSSIRMSILRVFRWRRAAIHTNELFDLRTESGDFETLVFTTDTGNTFVLFATSEERDWVRSVILWQLTT